VRVRWKVIVMMKRISIAMRDSSIRSKLKKLKVYRQLINYGILEDISEPKEAAHLDYKYLKTFEGPLT
jgi:hypothetical protein